LVCLIVLARCKDLVQMRVNQLHIQWQGVRVWWNIKPNQQSELIACPAFSCLTSTA